jgi:CzcA family heavy metal efflux pump
LLGRIITVSLRQKGVVLVLAALLLGYGVYDTRNAKLDVFPDFVPPQVTVQTEAPGLAAEQVEALVTRPVEIAIGGLGSQESIRSESIQGLSIVTVVFKENTDIFRARQLLTEKLGEISGQLAAGVKPPRVTPLVSSTMDLLKIGLLSEKLSPMDLRTFADWTVKPRLLAVPGVAKCSSFGGEVRQLQIRVKPDRLLAYDLSVTDVLNAARGATAVMGAGYVETSNQRITIQTEAQTLSAEELGSILLLNTTNGLPVRLRDVAVVQDGAEPKFGDTLIQGKPGVLLTMSSQYGANTMEVTERLEAALDEMKPVFQREGIQLFPRLHRPATFIEVSIANIRHSLWLGAALVSVVLLLFLGSFRTAFISLTAIPLSLLTAIVILQRLGMTLNTITLGGLAIAVGEVVDDAIIDVENIFRRLRENRTLANPRPVFAVVLDASLEVRSAVVYATFVVVLVFLPVLTLSGLQGSFFAPLAISYILAIGASLLVALTVTPALCLWLARGREKDRETRLQSGLKHVYRKIVGFTMRWPFLLLAISLVATLLGLWRIPLLGGEFLPEFKEGHFVLQMSTLPGTSLTEMRRIGAAVSAGLLKIPQIATVEQQIGRAELGEDPWGPHRSEFHIELKSAAAEDQEKAGDAIRAVLSNTPGIQFEVLTFLGDRIGESISGETAPVVVSVFGDNLEEINARAKEVAIILNGIRGSADVQVKAPPGAPRLVIKLRRERLIQLGYHPAELLSAIQSAFQGSIAAQVYQGNRVSDVNVILEESARSDPEAIGALQFRAASGARRPLRELADVYLSSGPYSLLHEGGRRRQTITCNVEGRDVTSFVSEAKQQVEAKVKLRGGTYLAFAGAAEAARAARNELLLHSAVAAAGIFLLLVMVFGNARNLILTLLNVPFALIGGVLALFVARLLAGHAAGTLSIGSLVGFVTLFGITMRNSIMLISHYEHLVDHEGIAWGPEAALRGASERLIPILMTALVAGLGLLPLALGSGEAGREIEGPMAIVILGGLVTSTTLNLLFLPSLALRFGRFGR